MAFVAPYELLIMSRKSKNKIATEHVSSLSAANPFAEIDLENLPECSDLKTGSDDEGAIPVKKKISSKGRVAVTREKSGRAGKLVTVLREFSVMVPIKELNEIAFELKKRCACGGSLKGRTIELQGDVSQQAMADLRQRGFEPVRCGY